MPNILHRLTIDAPSERVRGLVATKRGIQQWWTGHPVTGDDSVGGRLSVHFSDAPEPAASFEVLEDSPQRVLWRCVEGPDEWLDTRISFAFAPRADGGTTLLFTHQGWQQETEFMNGCSTNWAAYLMSLKAGGEGRRFNAFPGGEMSRWSDAPGAAESGQAQSEQPTTAENIETIRRFELAFRAANQATISELSDAGLVDYNPAPGHEGTLAGFQEKVASFKTMFPDLEEDLQDIVGSGNTVATRWVVTGSLQHDFLGIPAEGQPIKVEGINFYRLKGGRVTHIWTQFDGAGLMQQLGANPA